MQRTLACAGGKVARPHDLADVLCAHDLLLHMRTQIVADPVRLTARECVVQLLVDSERRVIDVPRATTKPSRSKAARMAAIFC